ncbi:MAG: hypothetical protein AB1656_03215 [Candidatus Omnitrophota bacterium]
MNKKLIVFVIAVSCAVISVPSASWSARIGYIVLEAVQNGMLGVDLNDRSFSDWVELVQDAKVLLETQTASAGILNHIKRLEEQGHIVNIYGSQTDDQLGLEYMEANNDLIIVSENPGSGETGAFYIGAKIPTIICESYLIDNYQLISNWSSGMPGDEDINAREFKVIKKDHPIARGLPEVFAPLAIDVNGSGKPYIGNWTVLAMNSRNLFKQNVVIELVDPVAPIPQENAYTLEPQCPVVWAFEKDETPLGNPARVAFFGWGTENATGVGLADNPIFADGSTAGIYAFDVIGDLGWKLWDNVVAWALGQEPVNVANWPLY